MTHPGAATEPPIVQYWHSPELPAAIAELTATFRDHNPDRSHLVFCEAEAEAFIAEHFTAREAAAFRACAVPAMQADYFRYCAALALGGACSDADFRCRRPLRSLFAKTDGGLLFRGSLGQVINGFFLFSAPGHPLLRLALDVATVGIEKRTAENVWSVTGPWIFTALSALHELGSPDALRRKAAERGMATSPELLLQVVGDQARVSEAFEGVQILPFETATHWIGGPEIQLPYKKSETHWVGWQKAGGTIFRSHE